MTITPDKLAVALLRAFEVSSGGGYVERDETSDDHSATIDGHFSLLTVASIALAMLSERPEQ